MATEIERKYLISTLPENLLAGQIANPILQGYIAVHEDKTEVRIRRFGGQYWQTIKSPGHLSRLEFELPIDEKLFHELWPLTQGRNLEKNRYDIPYLGKTIELDVYTGHLSGLMVAEVEFESIEESNRFTPPDWFGKEISGIRKYKNFILASEGLPQKDSRG
ncbi:MAG: CYTH domain-containing protein [Cyclobacteriaceae bacterium]